MNLRALASAVNDGQARVFRLSMLQICDESFSREYLSHSGRLFAISESVKFVPLAEGHTCLIAGRDGLH